MKKLIKILSDISWDNVGAVFIVAGAVGYIITNILTGHYREAFWPLLTALWVGNWYLTKQLLKSEIETNQRVIITQEYIIDALRKEKAALQELHKKHQS